jgi:hypothetical protein
MARIVFLLSMPQYRDLPGPGPRRDLTGRALPCIFRP